MTIVFCVSVSAKRILRFVVLSVATLPCLAVFTGCVKATEEAAPTVAKALAEDGVKLFEEQLEANKELRASKLLLPKQTVGDVLIDAAELSRRQALERIQPAVSRTKVAANMSQAALKMSWDVNPQFRIRAIAEISENDPGALSALADESGIIRPGFGDENATYKYALRANFASKREVISTLANDSLQEMPPSPAKNLVEARLQDIVSKAFEAIPKNVVEPTDAQLRSAVLKSLDKEHRLSPSFDAGSGILTLKVKIGYLEFSSPGIPVYKLVKTAYYMSGLKVIEFGENDLVQIGRKYFPSSIFGYQHHDGRISSEPVKRVSNE